MQQKRLLTRGARIIDRVLRPIRSITRTGSLTIRFVVGAAVVASLPLVITGIVIDQNNSRSVREAVAISHRSATAQAERAIANSAVSISADLQHLSSEPILRNRDSSVEDISETVGRYFEAVKLPNANDQILAGQPNRFEDLVVFRVDKESAFIETSVTSQFTGEWASSLWLRRATSGAVSYSPPHFGSTNDVLVSSIAVPVFTDSGELIRVVGARVRLSRLLALADLDGFSERDEIELRLLDRFGNYIAGVNHELLLERAETVPGGFNDLEIARFQDGPVAVIGTERVVGEGTIWASEGWRIRSVESMDLAYAEIRSARSGLITGFASGFVLILVLSAIVGRGVTRPLRTISRAITELGAGDYSARLKPRSGGELESLADSFNSMAESLQETHEDLVEIDRAKSEFLSSLSHELRTPLSAMLGFAQVMKNNRNGELGQKSLDRLDVINRNGRRLDAMINDLLDLTRIENKNIQLSISWFEVRELIGDIAQSFENMLSDRHNELTILLTDGPVWLNGDKDRVAQVVTNLISNASKYSEKGSSITIGVEFNRDEIAIRVTDNGQGIKPGDIDRLFSLFYRTEDAANSSTPGTGIGLFVSRRIAELHGGTVEVESRFGEGSTFKLILPGATAIEPAELRTPEVRQYSSRLDDLDLEDAS